MKPAGYADAMVATAGLLGILGLPLELQGYWAEPSAQRPLEGELDEREIAADLVPWLMERPKLSREQAELTVEGLRLEGGGPRVPDSVPASVELPLGELTGVVDPEDSSLASASEPEEPVLRVLDRKANYVIVELPGAIYRLHKAAI
ncbi:unnamed protein product, partial [Symbiodinium necroappetens]